MFNSSDLNKIKNIDSRRNFEMVLQSYYSNNNKASILLLYNLVVNDLYSKLVLMNDNGYVNCKSDLETIENQLRDGDESKYSIVEEKIFDIYRTKKILNHSTIDLLYYFKKIRNKCAHPFFFKEYDYTPSNEEVYLFIFKIYNDILIVDAFFKNPYEVMKPDIDSYQFPSLESIIMGVTKNKENIEKVELYFSRKYFRYMTDSNYVKLFKNLMDLTIFKNNEEVLLGQYKHYLLLCSLLNYLKLNGKISLLNNVYEWNKLNADNLHDDYDKCFNEQQCFSLSYLFRVLSYNNSFIEELKEKNEDVIEYIKNKLYKKAYLFAEFWNFFDIDINLAINKVTESSITYRDAYQFVVKLGPIVNRENLIKLVMQLLNKIPNFYGFDCADESIDLLIKIMSNIEVKFSQEEANSFFEIMNSNRQIYEKSRSYRNTQFTRIIELGYNFDSFDNLKI